MTEPTVEAVDRLFRRHGVRFVIIGGQAVAQRAATTTVDVDVMVTTDDYAAVVRRLVEEEAMAKAWDGGAVTRFGIKEYPHVPLDIVDAGAFSGTKSAAEFFAYLASEGSTEIGGVRYATPALVWYTRLLTKRWRAYAEKIVTNVIDGLSPGLLDEVETIARRFGAEPTVGPRVRYVREELDRPEVRALLGRG